MNNTLIMRMGLLCNGCRFGVGRYLYRETVVTSEDCQLTFPGLLMIDVIELEKEDVVLRYLSIDKTKWRLSELKVQNQVFRFNKQTYIVTIKDLVPFTLSVIKNIAGVRLIVTTASETSPGLKQNLKPQIETIIAQSYEPYRCQLDTV